MEVVPALIAIVVASGWLGWTKYRALHPRMPQRDRHPNSRTLEMQKHGGIGVRRQSDAVLAGVSDDLVGSPALPQTYAPRVSDVGLALKALRLVEDAGFQAALVGGWSRELLGLEPVREHSDVDLVVTDADIAALDHWLSSRDEIVAKRFAHKRAFRLDGTMVELHLVTRRAE